MIVAARPACRRVWFATAEKHQELNARRVVGSVNTDSVQTDIGAQNAVANSSGKTEGVALDGTPLRAERTGFFPSRPLNHRFANNFRRKPGVNAEFQTARRFRTFVIVSRWLAMAIAQIQLRGRWLLVSVWW